MSIRCRSPARQDPRSVPEPNSLSGQLDRSFDPHVARCIASAFFFGNLAMHPSYAQAAETRSSLWLEFAGSHKFLQMPFTLVPIDLVHSSRRICFSCEMRRDLIPFIGDVRKQKIHASRQ